ncbi:hypothetical protein [Fodinibius sp. Rm-B-1B1-1]|uniref:hypothetical protein n=1 Tax=Fodinibius alkaliphilus TaxID=3140241 RepID=UPI00315AB472
MIEDLIPIDTIGDIKLNRSNISIPSSLRYFKKLGFILLVLKKCSYAKKASVLKLQFFNWAFASTENLAKFHKIVSSSTVVSEDSIHLDPAINRTIEFAISEKFLSIDNNGKIELTENGIELADKIIDSENILNTELERLENIGRRVSEKQLKVIFEKITG